MRHIRDKLWPMPKHGSIILYVHGNQKARSDGQPRTATSTLTQLLNYAPVFSRPTGFYVKHSQFSFIFVTWLSHTTTYLLEPGIWRPCVKVPDEIKRSRDLRGGRWSWTFNLAQKRSWGGRWSWAAKVGLLLLRVVKVVRQQQCNGHCLCDSVQHSRWNSNCAVHKSLGNGEGTPP